MLLNADSSGYIGKFIFANPSKSADDIFEGRMQRCLRPLKVLE